MKSTKNVSTLNTKFFKEYIFEISNLTHTYILYIKNQLFFFFFKKDMHNMYWKCYIKYLITCMKENNLTKIKIISNITKVNLDIKKTIIHLKILKMILPTT